MRFFKDLNKNKELDGIDMPDIESVSEEIGSISQFLDVVRLPDAFKYNKTDTLPVIDINGKIAGIVSEYDLSKVAQKFSLPKESYMNKILVKDIMTTKVWSELENTNIKELFQKIDKMHTRVIPIVDKNSRYTEKCITRTKLINYLTRLIKPSVIAGMATPIGVYLSDGIHQAGAKNAGLFLNGAVFAVFVFGIRFFSFYLMSNYFVPVFIAGSIEILTFLALIKVTPFSRIHGAEHKVINTIEKGLPLTIETVKAQTRIHKRCGSNLVVFIFGILGVIFLTGLLIPKEYLFLKFIFSFFGFLFIISYWKNIGAWFQKIFTTSEPNEKQIKNGIKAGKSLLEIHKEDKKNVNPSFIQKVINGGILQTITSFLITLSLLEFLYSLVLG